MFQIHLNRKGMSGRAVRCEGLTLKQIESAEASAASECNKESLQAEFNAKTVRYGLEFMVKEITDAGIHDPASAKWTPVNPTDLHMNWSKYFNPKDSALLKAIYAQEHGVSQEDLDAITLGKVEVLAD
jgi:hypothetical protein